MVLVSAGLGSVGLIGSLGLYIFVLVGPNFTSLFCPVLGVLWFLLLYLLLLLFSPRLGETPLGPSSRPRICMHPVVT